MDYKFLADKALQKFFEESDLSVGQIFLALTQERTTGIKIENRSRFEEITDKEWSEIIEKVIEESIEDEPLNDKEWATFTNKFKDEQE